MIHAPTRQQRDRRRGWSEAVVFLLVVGTLARATAQENFRVQTIAHTANGAPEPPAGTYDSTGPWVSDGFSGGGCADCPPTFSDPLYGLTEGCDSCGAGCVPGRKRCHACTSKTHIGRFTCAMYEQLCCPDPCYVPKWTGLGNAAFFVESPRPVTQQRARWDAGRTMIFPDRAEYFWARSDGSGRGPDAPLLQSLDYDQLSIYTEAAAGTAFSFFIDMSYREVDPLGAEHGAGFSDMNMGTKSVMFDSELLLVTFQFRTFIPQANSSKGLGTGHVSLEPSVLVGLNVGPATYLQGQVSEWIPLGGDPDYAGSILHTHFSLNQVLYRWQPDVPLIGTMEVSSWSFQGGQYTDPGIGPVNASNETYVSAGPGFRVVVCEKIDFGVGVSFAITKDHFAERLYRSEFRWRF